VILPDGRNLNEEIVAAGWAWWYRQYSPGSRVLAALESEACNRHRGLWAAGDPTAPWEWRKNPLRSKRSDRRDTGRARR
jgi:endonuclease YncB( thermonuclease family)